MVGQASSRGQKKSDLIIILWADGNKQNYYCHRSYECACNIKLRLTALGNFLQEQIGKDLRWNERHC